jgi:hypothetical protein
MRVVLEFHRRGVGRAARGAAIAHRADEPGDGADARIAGAQRGGFLAEIEILVLDAHARYAGRSVHRMSPLRRSATHCALLRLAERAHASCMQYR